MSRGALEWPDGWRTPVGQDGPAPAGHSPYRTQEWANDPIDQPNAIDEHATVFRPEVSQTLLAQDSAERLVGALILEARLTRQTMERGYNQTMWLVAGSWAVAVLIAVILTVGQ